MQGAPHASCSYWKLMQHKRVFAPGLCLPLSRPGANKEFRDANQRFQDRPFQGPNRLFFNLSPDDSPSDLFQHWREQHPLEATRMIRVHAFA